MNQYDCMRRVDDTFKRSIRLVDRLQCELDAPV